MNRPLSALFIFAGAATAFAADPVLSPPAKNWSMVRFTRENYHSLTLRGAEARVRGDNEIDVTGLNLTSFVGDASNHVESILLSTTAKFFPKDNLATGEQGVRLIRDDLEATGTRWTYDHAEKKVSLHGNVRIVLNAELKDVLK